MWLCQKQGRHLLPDLVLAQNLNTSITLKAEELLNIMDFIHIDMELHAHADFNYRWSTFTNWNDSISSAASGWADVLSSTTR